MISGWPEMHHSQESETENVQGAFKSNLPALAAHAVVVIASEYLICNAENLTSITPGERIQKIYA